MLYQEQKEADAVKARGIVDRITSDPSVKWLSAVFYLSEANELHVKYFCDSVVAVIIPLDDNGNAEPMFSESIWS